MLINNDTKKGQQYYQKKINKKRNIKGKNLSINRKKKLLTKRGLISI